MRSRCFTKSKPFAAIALITLAGQLSSVGHLVLERHAVCLEHGELIHRAEADDATPPTSASRAQRSAMIDAVPAVVEVHGHDHCAFVGHRKRAYVPTSADRLALANVPQKTSARDQALPRQPRQAIFRLAPKGSPPA